MAHHFARIVAISGATLCFLLVAAAISVPIISTAHDGGTLIVMAAFVAPTVPLFAALLKRWETGSWWKGDPATVSVTVIAIAGFAVILAGLITRSYIVLFGSASGAALESIGSAAHRLDIVTVGALEFALGAACVIGIFALTFAA